VDSRLVSFGAVPFVGGGRSSWIHHSNQDGEKSRWDSGDDDGNGKAATRLL
jgi:hypothetical protein